MVTDHVLLHFPVLTCFIRSQRHASAWTRDIYAGERIVIPPAFRCKTVFCRKRPKQFYTIVFKDFNRRLIIYIICKVPL